MRLNPEYLGSLGEVWLASSWQLQANKHLHGEAEEPELVGDSFLLGSQVCLPPSVLEHIEPSECIFKVSSCVKTSRGVGKIAMTQRRLFLLTDGRPGYVDVAQYRDLEVRFEKGAEGIKKKNF